MRHKKYPLTYSLNHIEPSGGTLPRLPQSKPIQKIYWTKLQWCSPFPLAAYRLKIHSLPTSSERAETKRAKRLSDCSGSFDECVKLWRNLQAPLQQMARVISNANLGPGFHLPFGTKWRRNLKFRELMGPFPKFAANCGVERGTFVGIVLGLAWLKFWRLDNGFKFTELKY